MLIMTTENHLWELLDGTEAIAVSDAVFSAVELDELNRNVELLKAYISSSPLKLKSASAGLIKSFVNSFQKMGLL